MKYFVRTLLILLYAALPLLAGIAAVMLKTDPGVILIGWNGYTIEMRLIIGVGLLVFWGFGLPPLILLLLRYGPWRWWSHYRRHRGRKIARQETLIAINSWLSGDEDRALKALDRVAKAGGSERLPEAVSLAIGLTHGDWIDRYSALVNKDAELKMFAQSLMAERYWQSQQQEEFITLMQNHFELQQIVWLRERYWNALLAKGDSLHLVKLISEAPNMVPEQREKWLLRAVEASLLASKEDKQKREQVLKALTKAQRKLPAMVVAEAQFLMQVNKHELAFKRLKALMTEGDLTQVTLLLDLNIENEQKLNFLESLQPSTPKADYCLVLGTLNCRQQLWGNAQSWLEKGWSLGDRECGLALADLLEQRNMAEQAHQLYRNLAKNAQVVAS